MICQGKNIGKAKYNTEFYRHLNLVNMYGSSTKQETMMHFFVFLDWNSISVHLPYAYNQTELLLL